ncbi:hypothetical protein [Pseudorhodoferax sp.]|uniref:hypothetical protein n=1 Tax=Pseudorhodoferax sp. TaxID=1993553 RepID=UPI0039E2916B
MAHAAPVSSDVPPIPATPLAWAARVLRVTAGAWQLGPRSPRALARRAPVGYVPRRARRRAAALAHSW